jgi:hypothetical protein
MKIAKKQMRIIKKIHEASGVWRFIILRRAGSRYVWTMMFSPSSCAVLRHCSTEITVTDLCSSFRASLPP